MIIQVTKFFDPDFFTALPRVLSKLGKEQTINTKANRTDIHTCKASVSSFCTVGVTNNLVPVFFCVWMMLWVHFRAWTARYTVDDEPSKLLMVIFESGCNRVVCSFFCGSTQGGQAPTTTTLRLTSIQQHWYPEYTSLVACCRLEITFLFTPGSLRNRLLYNVTLCCSNVVQYT